jgi:hypothetical protein
MRFLNVLSATRKLFSDFFQKNERCWKIRFLKKVVIIHVLDIYLEYKRRAKIKRRFLTALSLGGA